MERALAIKLITLLVLILLLLIPLSMLDGLVQERQQRGEEVAAEISQSAAGPQLLAGPVLRIETLSRQLRERTVLENGVSRSVAQYEERRSWRLIAPSSLQVDTTQRSERRARGPFSALLHHGEHRLRARFEAADFAWIAALDADTRIVSASVSMLVTDPRGVSAAQLRVNRVEHRLDPGSGLPWHAQGLQSAITPLTLAGAPLDIELELALTGSGSWGWVALGSESQISLSSDWPHPSFGGHLLPQQREINATGFSATWRSSRLSSGAQQALADCGNEPGPCPAFWQNAFQVDLVDPVDRYLMSERALKYALLFLLLVFGAVFFVEVLKRLRVHPMQYALTALALAMFFLLLLSLSEHVGFATAYTVAALACCSLIGFYMAAVLQSRARGLGFAALLGGLYGLLYGLLQAEDIALLLGSIGLFALLATVMLATRRLDWNRLGAS